MGEKHSKPEEEETLCIRTQEANLRNPQLTLDQDEDETSKTILIGDASTQDLDTPLWSADQQSKKAAANTPLSTSTPARNRDEENRRSRESSEASESFQPEAIETSRASINNTVQGSRTRAQEQELIGISIKELI